MTNPEQNRPDRPSGETRDDLVYHPVSRADTLAEGDMQFVAVDGREILIARVDGDLRAVGARCTHAAWVMNDTPLLDGEITCSLHGARFDVCTGRAKVGPARKPLDRYEIRERHGQIEVGLRPRTRPLKRDASNA